ncbi:hypothetical protein [Aquifex sp.]
MLIKVFIPVILLFLVSCVQKVNIHEVLGKNTLTTKPVLVKHKDIDVALQKVALKKLEEQIKNPPLDVKLKANVFKRGVKILVAKGSLEEINDYDFLSEKYGNADILIIMEIKSTQHSERKYISNVEDEFGTKYFCVEREARAVVLFNVLNPKTREVFFAKTYRGLDYKRYCDEKTFKPEKLPKKELILLKAIERTIGAFIRDFFSIL